MKNAFRHSVMEYYEITVDSRIDQKRSRDFGGMEFKYLDGGGTLLSGMLADQAELFSVLNKIRDMNLILVAIKKQKYKEGEF